MNNGPTRFKQSHRRWTDTHQVAAQLLASLELVRHLSIALHSLYEITPLDTSDCLTKFGPVETPAQRLDRHELWAEFKGEVSTNAKILPAQANFVETLTMLGAISTLS